MKTSKALKSLKIGFVQPFATPGTLIWPAPHGPGWATRARGSKPPEDRIARGPTPLKTAPAVELDAVLDRLLSTARDSARFLETIRNGGTIGSVTILAPRTVELMTTNQVGTLHSTNGLGFGLGFETTERYGANGMDSRGAFGWGGAYGTLYRVDPEARLVMVLMIQQLPNTTDIREKFPTLVYQSLLGSPSKSD